MFVKLFKKLLLLVGNTVVKIGGILVVLAIIDYLLKWKIINLLWKTIASPIKNIWLQLQSEAIDSPIITLTLFVTLVVLFYLFFILWKRISTVAGEFTDDFSNGLSKWEFGGEGWKIEKENNDHILSVSESSDGGITNRGFSWSDYQFSFETKIINKNVGWIIRAESRNKYLMVQLNLEDVEKPKLRFHLRLPHSDRRNFDWMVTQVDELDYINKIEKYCWVKVRIMVLGSNIDVYLNNQHAAHYFVADPIKWKEEYQISKGSEPKVGTFIATINYGAGKVGFRCSQDEHAHFRNVKVKPL